MHALQGRSVGTVFIQRACQSFCLKELADNRVDGFQLSVEYEGLVRFVKLDTDEEAEFAEYMGVSIYVPLCVCVELRNCIFIRVVLVADPRPSHVVLRQS